MFPSDGSEPTTFKCMKHDVQRHSGAVSGAVVGGVIGSILPGIGTLAGVLVGGFIGHWTEEEEHK